LVRGGVEETKDDDHVLRFQHGPRLFANRESCKPGNLILVPSVLNQQLGSKSFQQKKKLFTAKKVPLDADLDAASSWDRKAIRRRTSALAKLTYDKIFRV
jgi:uncharacterized protein DUF1524